MFQYIQFRFFGTIAKEAAISAADAKPAMQILFRGRLVGRVGVWMGGWVCYGSCVMPPCTHQMSCSRHPMHLLLYLHAVYTWLKCSFPFSRWLLILLEASSVTYNKFFNSNSGKNHGELSLGTPQVKYFCRAWQQARQLNGFRYGRSGGQKACCIAQQWSGNLESKIQL